MTLPSGIRLLAPIRQFLPITARIHDQALDADQAVVADDAAVQHGEMADRDIATEGQQDAGVGVQDGAVLHVGVFADGDDVVVAAHHDVEPDAGVLLQNHRTDDGGVVGDEPVFAVKFDLAVAERVDHRILLSEICAVGGSV
jgi:hypothetical protein